MRAFAGSCGVSGLCRAAFSIGTGAGGPTFAEPASAAATSPPAAAVWLAENFGNSAEWLFNLARGIDHRRVKSNRPLKSLGGERTFFNDLIGDTEIREALAHVCSVVWDRAAKKGARGRTVTLKLRYADFRTITRAKSVPSPILDGAALLAAGEAILAPLLPTEQGIRLLGLTLSKFEGEDDDENDFIQLNSRSSNSATATASAAPA